MAKATPNRSAEVPGADPPLAAMDARQRAVVIVVAAAMFLSPLVASTALDVELRFQWRMFSVLVDEADDQEQSGL